MSGISLAQRCFSLMAYECLKPLSMTEMWRAGVSGTLINDKEVLTGAGGGVDDQGNKSHQAHRRLSASGASGLLRADPGPGIGIALAAPGPLPAHTAPNKDTEQICQSVSCREILLPPKATGSLLLLSHHWALGHDHDHRR